MSAITVLNSSSGSMSVAVYNPALSRADITELRGLYTKNSAIKVNAWMALFCGALLMLPMMHGLTGGLGWAIGGGIVLASSGLFAVEYWLDRRRISRFASERMLLPEELSAYTTIPSSQPHLQKKINDISRSTRGESEAPIVHAAMYKFANKHSTENVVDLEALQRASLLLKHEQLDPTGPR